MARLGLTKGVYEWKKGTEATKVLLNSNSTCQKKIMIYIYKEKTVLNCYIFVAAEKHTM